MRLQTIVFAISKPPFQRDAVAGPLAATTALSDYETAGADG